MSHTMFSSWINTQFEIGMYSFSDKSVIESRTCSEVVFCQIALSKRATLIEKLKTSEDQYDNVYEDSQY